MRALEGGNPRLGREQKLEEAPRFLMFYGKKRRFLWISCMNSWARLSNPINCFIGFCFIAAFHSHRHFHLTDVAYFAPAQAGLWRPWLGKSGEIKIVEVNPIINHLPFTPIYHHLPNSGIWGCYKPHPYPFHA
jgi:hypothetical protein